MARAYKKNPLLSSLPFIALALALPAILFLLAQRLDIRQRASSSDLVISGKVFVDSNNNGRKDDGEIGYAGATLIVQSPSKDCSPTVAPTCIPRPGCLDNPIRPCKLPEPATGWCPKPTTTVCAQVITSAINPKTQECRDFPTPCDVPSDWEKVPSCPTPTLPAGCYYKKVPCPQRPCVNGRCDNRCEPELVCPTPTQPSRDVRGERDEQRTRPTPSPVCVRLPQDKIQTDSEGNFAFPIEKSGRYEIELVVPNGYYITTGSNSVSLFAPRNTKWNFGISTTTVAPTISRQRPTPLPTVSVACDVNRDGSINRQDINAYARCVNDANACTGLNVLPQFITSRGTGDVAYLNILLKNCNFGR